MSDIRKPHCGECCFFKAEDASGLGCCLLKDYETMRCDEQCDLDHTKMRRACSLEGLREFQEWRRGGKGKQPHPYVIGKIIDGAIYRLRHDVI